MKTKINKNTCLGAWGANKVAIQTGTDNQRKSVVQFAQKCLLASLEKSC